jgi:hypothetical protein
MSGSCLTDLRLLPWQENAAMSALSSVYRRYRWPLGLAVTTVIAAAYLVLQEIDSLLRTLDSAGQQHLGMSALTGLHGDGETARQALALWGTTGGPRAFDWVRDYAVADTVFALAYTPLLMALLRRLTGQARWIWLAVALLAADVTENILTAVLAGRSRPVAAALPPPGTPNRVFESPALADYVFIFSIIKWVMVGTVLVVLTYGGLNRWLGANRPGDDAPGWWRVAWRFRIQLFVVAVLAFLVAVPTSDRLGALEQLPDVLRGFLAGGDQVLPAVLSFAALAVLGAAIWLSAHWQWFPDERSDRGEPGWHWPYHAIGGLALLWMLFFAIQMIYPKLLGAIGVDQPPPWASRWQVAVPSLAGAVVMAAAWGLHRRYGLGAPRRGIRRWHERHGRLVHLLTVAPIVVGGLGLVRAGVALAMLPYSSTTGMVGIGAGAGLAILLGPIVLGVIGRSSRRETDPAEGLPAIPLRTHRVANWLCAIFATVTVVALAGWPVQVAPPIGAPGVFTLGLAVIAIGLGGLVAIGQRSQPILVDRLVGDATRAFSLPVVPLLIAVSLAVTLTDGADTYHEVRYTAAPSSSGAKTLAGHFTDWQKALAGCGESAVPDKPRVQPLVMVAAAGGGIRAAYWTERALLQLTGAATADTAGQALCRRNSVFLVSGVSGGSVGASLWGAQPASASVDTTPFAKAIASQDALSALMAGFLFRDTARAGTGLDFGWSDRAAAMESTWNNELQAAGADLSGPYSGGNRAEGTWNPLLLLNGADLQTGCRVVIAPIIARDEPDTPAGGSTGTPPNCEEAADAGSALPGAYYAPQFLDTSRCTATGTRTMSGTTAALLSARFPFVTPTGSLYACNSAHDQVVQVQIGDGGYIESSGIQAALQSWRAIEPLVAAHNQEVVTRGTATVLPNAVILPVFVIISNSYRSVATAPAPAPQGQLLAPVVGAEAALNSLSPARLEAEVRAEFSQLLPGTLLADPGFRNRVIDIAPASRPEITAPLGWALSPQAEQSLDRQLADLVADKATGSTGAALDYVRALMPGDTSDLGQPLVG